MKSNLKIILFYVVLIGVILAATSVLFSDTQQTKISYSDIISYFEQEKVESFVVDEKLTITLQFNDGTAPVEYRLRSLDLFVHDVGDLVLTQQREGIIKSYDYTEIKEVPWWVSLLPYVIVIAVFIVLWIIVMNQASGKGGKIASFGRVRAKLGSDEKKRIYFSDVAGADEEKEELREVVEFLRNPARYVRLGAHIPHGVLLVGPPGTGKTLLAKAVAGEAGVPFYSISGSDFVEMYVGVGASRVRDLFDTAKKSPASIIFIDEIDAVGRHRGAGLGGGHDEREQTLNQLLVEMDGFGNNDGIIVIAATNRPDILDPALLRPGRFDRQITVGYPDLKGRFEILKVHAKNKPFEEDVDLHKVAQTTVGFTGADLANLLNEAALIAARKDKSLIGMNDIEEASIKVIVGIPKRNRMKEDEKKKTAYHEAGHAILSHVLPTQDPVRQISIIPSGRALGYTLTPPVEDKYSVYKNSLKEEIAMLLGGRVAEKIIFDDISSGASNDIQRATEIARNMVMKYGMSDALGPIVYGGEHSEDEVFLGRDFNNTRNYSEQTAAKIDAEIKNIVDWGYDTAERVLRENMEKLHFIANFLVKNEVMDDVQFSAAMEGNPTVEELEAMVAEKRRRSEEENQKRREAEEKARARDEEERKKREEAAKRSAMSPMEMYAEQIRNYNESNPFDGNNVKKHDEHAQHPEKDSENKNSSESSEHSENDENNSSENGKD